MMQQGAYRAANVGKRDENPGLQKPRGSGRETKKKPWSNDESLWLEQLVFKAEQKHGPVGVLLLHIFTFTKSYSLSLTHSPHPLL